MKLPGFRTWRTRMFGVWAAGATVYIASRVLLGIEGAPRYDPDPSIPVFSSTYSGDGSSTSYGGGHSSSSGGGSSYFGK